MATISWSCFILLAFGKFSSAGIPDECDNPMAIEFFNLHSKSMTDVRGNSVYLCQLNGSEDFLIWDGEKGLIYFRAKEVTFKLMSGNTFWIDLDPPNGHYLMTGRFKRFSDFEHFHSLVNQDVRCSPKKFIFERVESFLCERYAKDVDLEISHTRPTVLSQYSVDQKLVDSGAALFVIEDPLTGFGEAMNAYLTLRPHEFRCSREPIGSQVVISPENENKYYVFSFDTSENAESFISYVCNFALPEPRFPKGYPLPRALEIFLKKRNQSGSIL